MIQKDGWLSAQEPAVDGGKTYDRVPSTHPLYINSEQGVNTCQKKTIFRTGQVYLCNSGCHIENYICDSRTSKTLQELRMLSNVTLDCHVTQIVMNSGSQMSEL